MMKDSKPDWRLLCEQAAKETDFNKLLELTAEITRLLDQREECLEALAERVVRIKSSPGPTLPLLRPLIKDWRLPSSSKKSALRSEA